MHKLRKLLLLASLIAAASAHGRLSAPQSRDALAGRYVHPSAAITSPHLTATTII